MGCNKGKAEVDKFNRCRASSEEVKNKNWLEIRSWPQK